MGGETEDEDGTTGTGRPVKKKMKRNTCFNNDWKKNVNYSKWLIPTQAIHFLLHVPYAQLRFSLSIKGFLLWMAMLKQKKPKNRVQLTRQTRERTTFQYVLTRPTLAIQNGFPTAVVTKLFWPKITTSAVVTGKIYLL